ncbi:MAG: response regulator [Acidobacteria bacterium]|nr:response regulator [Acidobacteriota bacterium]
MLTSPSTSPVNILLVEDNPDHAELVMRGLEEVHPQAQITHLTDGEAALNFLFKDANQTRPDFVLLDLRLPKIDGLEVLRQIKADPHMRALPVIVLTTSSAVSDIEKAYCNYVNSYLVKPTEYSQFLDLLADLGLYWAEWNAHVKAI